MPIGPYPDFDSCHKAMMSKGKSDESAKKICGAMEKRMHDASTVEVEEKDGHLYLKAFLLDSSVNLNEWGVSRETLDQNINTYIGKPLVVQEDFNHPDSGDPNYDHHLQYQEQFRIGNIIDVVNKDNIYSAIIEVTNPEAKTAFRNGDLPLYVSPQIFHDGVGRESDQEAKTWRATHLAIVKEPAFGIKKARVEGQCNGDKQTCVAQLKKASCNFCIKRTINNYTKTKVTKNKKQVNSSLENNNPILSSKLEDINKKTDVQVKTYSEEEYTKLKTANEQLKAEVDSLKQTNTQISEENKTVSASLESLKGEYRKDKVASILSNVFYKTDEDRNKALESFTKSGMTYEEIDSHVAPLRTVKSGSINQTETKLPQKSAAVEEGQENNKKSSFISLYESQFGGLQ